MTLSAEEQPQQLEQPAALQPAQDDKKKVDKRSCLAMGGCINGCARVNRVCPWKAKKAGDAVHRATEKLVKNSALFDGKLPELRQLNKTQVRVGKMLGQGGFSRVDSGVIISQDENQEMEKVAIKYLKHSVMIDTKKFCCAASDLWTEANILNVLDHPNIIRLHGVAAGSTEDNVASGKDAGYFIAVDRLFDTLSDRLEVWRMDNEPYSILSKFSRGYFTRQHDLLLERLQVAQQIASAMEYLHSRSIVFRDLKPDNVGFTKDGNVKLFDFGLAKEVKAAERWGGGNGYRMSGNTGTRRYMAPEVARDEPYNTSVDVYSFGIMLWEMLTGEKAFMSYATGSHLQRVIMGTERPSLEKSLTYTWPDELLTLLTKCWAALPEDRPSFEEIGKMLEKCLQALEDSPVTYRRHSHAETAQPSQRKSWRQMFQRNGAREKPLFLNHRHSSGNIMTQAILSA